MKMPSIPKVDSLPIIHEPPSSTPQTAEDPENNLLVLATTNCLLNQAQSHSNSPRRLTIESQNGSGHSSPRRHSLAPPKLSSKRPSVSINKIPLMR